MEEVLGKHCQYLKRVYPEYKKSNHKAKKRINVSDDENEKADDEKAVDAEPDHLPETFAIVKTALMDISVNDDWRPL